MSTKKKQKPWSVFIAIIAAVIFGSYVGKDATLFGISYYTIFNTFGTMFLNALTLVVVPLVSSSIITGIARIGGDGGFGRIGVKTFGFYIGTSLLAILIGLFFVNLLQPGSSIDPLSANETVSLDLNKQGSVSLINVLISIVPSNAINAFSQGHMLGLIFFSILFGYALSKINRDASDTVQKFFQGIFETMIRITHIVMRLLPYGVFCLIAKVFMGTGIGSLQSVALFTVTVVLGLATFMFIGLPILLRFIGRVSPLRHFKAMSPALITAFSTSSSSATLPVTIDCVEKRAGVSNRICSLVVPLGTSINMSGSALYECVAALFVAQAYGIEISGGTQFLVVLMSLVTSIGVAGIPSGSLVALLVILKSMGLPPEGIGLFLAVDRLLDMCRTTVNVFSDSCCAILVARAEGESQVLAKDPAESYSTK